jgi:penicillin-binding protein 2
MAPRKKTTHRTEKQSFSRRSLVLGGVQIGLFAGLMGRLQYLQISQAEAYTTLANANRINVSPILAENNRNLSVQILPERVQDLPVTLDQLQAILGLSDGQMQKIEKDIRRNPLFKPTTIAEDLPWKRFSKLNTQLPFLPGVEPIIGEKRVYTHAQAAAHLIGYVAPKTRADIRQFGDIANDFVGQTGMEREFEENLRGVWRSMFMDAKCASFRAVQGRQARICSSPSTLIYKPLPPSVWAI